MILIVKGKPDRVMCCQCRHLYEPNEQELRTSPVFICHCCIKAIRERFRPFNRRRRKSA